MTYREIRNLIKVYEKRLSGLKFAMGQKDVPYEKQIEIRENANKIEQKIKILKKIGKSI